MATFFGEVLPVTSRAIDDEDEEDQILPPCEPIIHWSKRMKAELERSGGQKIPCTNLVVALGLEANAFTEIYVKQFSYEIVGGIFTSLQDDDPFTVSQKSPTDKTCYIYRCHSNPNIIVIQCNRDVPPDQSFDWAKLLYPQDTKMRFEFCNSFQESMENDPDLLSKIIFSDEATFQLSEKIYDHIDLSVAYIAVLTTNTTGNFCSDVPPSDLDTPFLRALKSEKFLGTPICKILEQPNMVTGLAAQLMTFFQVHQSKAVIYICYKESKYVDIDDVKSFLPVLKVTPIKDITEPNKNADQMLRDIIELHSNHDTLYM